MLQVRSHLDVADNTGAKVAWNIGVLGRNQRYAGIGDVIKVYQGKGVPEGKKSLAMGLTFQAFSRNLTDADIDAALAQVLVALERDAQAVLRT